MHFTAFLVDIFDETGECEILIQQQLTTKVKYTLYFAPIIFAGPDFDFIMTSSLILFHDIIGILFQF